MSLSALASVPGRRTHEPISPFQFPRYPKGVLPNGATQLAMDEANQQIVTAFDFGTSFHGLFSEGIGFFGYPYLAELSQRAEYRRASEVIAEEMTRKWIKVKATGEEDKSEKIAIIEEDLQRFRVREHFRDAMEHDGFFGRGQIYIDYGHDDSDILAQPLRMKPELLGQGTLKGFKVIDPTWTAPNRYSSLDPTKPTFYQPQTWFIMGREIHASRLLIFIGRPLPDMLKPAYNFGGLSLSQMMKPYVDNWLRTRQAVSDLINSFTVFTLETNLQGLLAGAGGQDEQRRLEILTQTRDNRGLLVVNNTADNVEKISNTSAPLGTLDHLQAQSQEQICSVIAVPLVKYLGVTPSGLNASADGEIRVFYDGIHARQERVMGDNVRTVLQIIQLDRFGEIDDDIDFEFVPLWELDEQGAATVRKTNADTDAVLAEVGAIDADEIRIRVANELNSPYAGLDLSKPAPGPPAQGEPGEEPPPEGKDATGSAILAALASPDANDADLNATIADALGANQDDGALLRTLTAAFADGDDYPSIARIIADAVRFDDDAMVNQALAHALAQDEVNWQEGDHPRDEGGKFTAGGGGTALQSITMPKANKTLEVHQSKSLKAMHSLVNNSKTVEEAVGKLKAYTSQLAHPVHANYANEIISALGAKHGLSGLGQAKSKSASAMMPKEIKPQAPTGSPQYHPATTQPAQSNPTPANGPLPHPSAPQQQEIHKIVTGAGSNADKIAKIKAMPNVQNYPNGFTASFAKEWVKALGGNPDDITKATPAAPKPKVSTAGTVTHTDSDVTHWANDLFSNAAKPSNTKASGTKQIAPTLNKSFWDSAPANAVSAVHSYVGSGYHGMNAVLRGQVDPDDSSSVAKVKAVHKLFQKPEAKLTEDVIMRRGVGEWDPKLLPAWKSALAHGLPAIYTAEGFVSASMADHAAFSGKKLIFEMVCRKGTKALGIDTISSLTENELILSHGQQFEIYEIKEQGGQHIVRMVSGKAMED